MRKCVNCWQLYNERGEHLDEPPCESQDYYNPADGRCMGCFLDFLFRMYGGWMEPVFFIDGKGIFSDGKEVYLTQEQP